MDESSLPSHNRSGTPSLKTLLAAAQGGDREALLELFTRHEPMLLRWARRRLGQPLRTLDETRDILHDTYEVVLRKIGSFRARDSRSFPRWLRGIVVRVILQKAGNPYLLRRAPLLTSEQPLDLELTPLAALSLKDLERLRWRLVRELPHAERLIYRMRQRGWSSAQLAERLSVSDRAVRLRHAKAEARLRLSMRRHLES